jgi:Rieske Fe-S protein
VVLHPFWHPADLKEAFVSAPDRRSVLRGAAAVAVGGVAGFVVAQNSDAAKALAAGAAANAYGAAAPAAADDPVAQLTDVPSGGGLVVGDVVITRDGDTVHAFSATCTHQGCIVSDVTDGEIHCPCHGSAFDASTGAVVTGPATRPLPVVGVEVRDGAIFRTAGG